MMLPEKPSIDAHPGDRILAYLLHIFCGEHISISSLQTRRWISCLHPGLPTFISQRIRNLFASPVFYM
ncbi:hypothetical protein MLD38_019423 [Melastoma candidum]|uniref:Uncharacterized protein n=1 Tax=Melastoma candidum TaxID=119954 RepID=A0ACB9QWE1_9MYRT|nr:hypothetical protein MLD38_019423 [Melastoma candidum]